MNRFLRFAVALAAAFSIGGTAIAQTPEPKFNPVGTPTENNPAPVKLRCWDGATAKFVACSFTGGGGGGGGSGDASASNQTTQITAANLTNTRLGDITAPAAGSVNARLEAIRALLATALPLPTGAATAANQATGNASLATIAGHVGATGSASPSTAAYVGGVGPNGNLRGVAVDTRGGLVPGQGVVASTRTTLTASTATLIGAAGSTRVGVTVQVEAALTANLHICSTQTTSCSATSYDFLIPSGATAGTSYTFLFATTGTIYAFSTGTPVVVLNSWTAQ